MTSSHGPIYCLTVTPQCWSIANFHGSLLVSCLQPRSKNQEEYTLKAKSSMSTPEAYTSWECWSDDMGFHYNENCITHGRTVGADSFEGHESAVIPNVVIVCWVYPIQHARMHGVVVSDRVECLGDIWAQTLVLGVCNLTVLAVRYSDQVGPYVTRGNSVSPLNFGSRSHENFTHGECSSVSRQVYAKVM